jgi:hypothetical protein
MIATGCAPRQGKTLVAGPRVPVRQRPWRLRLTGMGGTGGYGGVPMAGLPLLVMASLLPSVLG